MAARSGDRRVSQEDHGGRELKTAHFDDLDDTVEDSNEATHTQTNLRKPHSDIVGPARADEGLEAPDGDALHPRLQSQPSVHAAALPDPKSKGVTSLLKYANRRGHPTSYLQDLMKDKFQKESGSASSKATVEAARTKTAVEPAATLVQTRSSRGRKDREPSKETAEGISLQENTSTSRYNELEAKGGVLGRKPVQKTLRDPASSPSLQDLQAPNPEDIRQDGREDVEEVDDGLDDLFNETQPLPPRSSSPGLVLPPVAPADSDLRQTKTPKPKSTKRMSNSLMHVVTPESAASAGHDLSRPGDQNRALRNLTGQTSRPRSKPSPMPSSIANALSLKRSWEESYEDVDQSGRASKQSCTTNHTPAATSYEYPVNPYGIQYDQAYMMTPATTQVPAVASPQQPALLNSTPHHDLEPVPQTISQTHAWPPSAVAAPAGVASQQAVAQVGPSAAPAPVVQDRGSLVHSAPAKWFNRPQSTHELQSRQRQKVKDTGFAERNDNLPANMKWQDICRLRPDYLKGWHLFIMHDNHVSARDLLDNLPVQLRTSVHADGKRVRQPFSKWQKNLTECRLDYCEFRVAQDQGTEDDYVHAKFSQDRVESRRAYYRKYPEQANELVDDIFWLEVDKRQFQREITHPKRASNTETPDDGESSAQPQQKRARTSYAPQPSASPNSLDVPTLSDQSMHELGPSQASQPGPGLVADASSTPWVQNLAVPRHESASTPVVNAPPVTPLQADPRHSDQPAQHTVADTSRTAEAEPATSAMTAAQFQQVLESHDQEIIELIKSLLLTIQARVLRTTPRPQAPAEFALLRQEVERRFNTTILDCFRLQYPHLAHLQHQIGHQGVSARAELGEIYGPYRVPVSVLHQVAYSTFAELHSRSVDESEAHHEMRGIIHARGFIRDSFVRWLDLIDDPECYAPGAIVHGPSRLPMFPF